MAVLPFCPGLTVKIFVNSAPLPKYDDDSDTPASPTTITKYVEATSGTRFVIKVSLTEGFPFPEGDMEAKISLDGRIMARHFISKDNFFGHYLCEGRGVQIGGYPKIQKYCVSKLEIVEGSTPLCDLTSIGIIAIGLTYIRNLHSTNPNDIVESILESTQVPGDALKGQLHTHRAGVCEPVAHTKTTWVHYDDITESPFATFDFKYRSVNALRALGLIPREPTPLPLEERPEEELSQDELRQLVKQLKEQKVAAVQVKKEAVDKLSSVGADTIGI